MRSYSESTISMPSNPLLNNTSGSNILDNSSENSTNLNTHNNYLQHHYQTQNLASLHHLHQQNHLNQQQQQNYQMNTRFKNDQYDNSAYQYLNNQMNQQIPSHSQIEINHNLNPKKAYLVNLIFDDFLRLFFCQLKTKL